MKEQLNVLCRHVHAPHKFAEYLQHTDYSVQAAAHFSCPLVSIITRTFYEMDGHNALTAATKGIWKFF